MSSPPAKKLDVTQSLRDLLADIRKRIQFYTQAFRLPLDAPSDQNTTHDWDEVKAHFHDRVKAFLRHFS